MLLGVHFMSIDKRIGAAVGVGFPGSEGEDGFAVNYMGVAYVMTYVII